MLYYVHVAVLESGWPILNAQFDKPYDNLYLNPSANPEHGPYRAGDYLVDAQRGGTFTVSAPGYQSRIAETDAIDPMVTTILISLRPIPKPPPPPPNRGPVAQLSASPESGMVPLAVTLDAAGSFDPDGRIVTFAWYPGDNTPAISGQASKVTHTYNRAGIYQARLEVLDDDGAKSADQREIRVERDPVACTNLVARVSGMRQLVKDLEKELVEGDLTPPDRRDLRHEIEMHKRRIAEIESDAIWKGCGRI